MSGIPLIAILSATAAQFDLVAYEAPGMNPAENTIVIRDARSRLPTLLRSCGIVSFRNVPATDGAVVFRFQVQPEGRAITCLRDRLPNGAQLLP